VDIRLVYSNLDPVGLTIRKLRYNFEEISEDVIDFKYEKGDAIVIFSRHQSKAGVPSLTVHYPGNPVNEVIGGEPNKLGIAYPRLLTSILREIKKLNVEIEKTMEATHHGPTYQNIPVIFVEVGSNPEYWNNEKIVKMVVDATLKAIEKVDDIECKGFISGFGGPHYSHLFTQLSEEYCIGHVISKHYIDKLSNEVIIQVINKSINNIDKVILDSLNSRQKQRLLYVLRNFDINIEFR
jgi:D-aminoacyl-tRNA deacylase